MLKIGVDNDYPFYLIEGFSASKFYKDESLEEYGKKRRKTEKRITNTLNKKFLN